MKALVFHGRKRLSVEEVADPVPTLDNVVLRVLAAGVCGSDIHGIEGSNGRRFPGQIMGHEAVGRVVKTGKNSTHLLDQVMTFSPIVSCASCPACRAGSDNRCEARKLIGVDPTLPGAFAEMVAVPSENLTPWPSPSFVTGALVEPLSVVWRALSILIPTEPRRVLILGAGTIGSMGAVALKSRFQCEVDIFDPITWKATWLKPHGVGVLESVEAGKDGTQTPQANLAYDAVLDCVGTTASLATALRLIASGGRVHVLGMAAPVIDYPLEKAVKKEVCVSTSYAYTRNEFAEAAKAAIGLEDILMAMKPQTCGLEDAAEKIEFLLSPDSQLSKVVITP